MTTTSGDEESKLQHSDKKSSAVDWQDLIPDFSLEGVVSSYNDLHGLDMDDVSKIGDFHFESLEFSWSILPLVTVELNYVFLFWFNEVKVP